MHESSEQTDKGSGSTSRGLIGRKLAFERETCFFILVSALDVIMTWILLSRRGFVESNPIASFFIAHWGIKGMVYFKFALVAFVSVLCQIIALKKADVARRILLFATALVACVVIYSFTLLICFASPIPSEFP